MIGFETMEACLIAVKAHNGCPICSAGLLRIMFADCPDEDTLLYAQTLYFDTYKKDLWGYIGICDDYKIGKIERIGQIELPIPSSC